MPLTLYAFKGSRGFRVHWLLEELGVPYELKLLPSVLAGGAEAAESRKTLRGLGGTGEVPTLVLEDGTVLNESAFILEYLMKKYGQKSELAPRNAKEQDRTQYGLYTAEGNLMIAGISMLIHQTAWNKLPYGVSFVVRQLLQTIDSYYAKPKFNSCLKELQAHIDQSGGYYAADHITIADVMFEYDTRLLDSLVNYQQQYPGIYAWKKRLESRPAYKRAWEQESR